LDKLKFWKSSDAKSEVANNQSFRIYVSAQDDKKTSSVQVLTREGGIDRSPQAMRVLNLLLEQLR
jgi:outer membrane protein assembly factor BamC